MGKTAKLDLNIETDVLTEGLVADIVNEVLELLLYQRNQIPFVYKTYKYYVQKWQEDKNDDGSPGNFNLERQRDLATQTKQSISSMRQLIIKAFAKSDIKCIRFLLGSTSHTPLEAYTIHVPTAAISKTHSYIHHRIPQSRINQNLITFLTDPVLNTIFSHNLCPTNLFLELETLDDRNLVTTFADTQLLPKELCDLPASCKDIQINLVLLKTPYSQASTVLQCCKELKVYSDFRRLSLTSNDSFADCNKNNDKSLVDDAPPKTAWWEAEVFVRGFKEKPVKAVNFWAT